MSCSNGGVSKATNMDTSRRLFLTGCLGTAASACFGQGVATRKATAQPRGKSSGLPFDARFQDVTRSEEHTSELQSHSDIVCRLLLEKKKQAARAADRGPRPGASAPVCPA